MADVTLFLHSTGTTPALWSGMAAGVAPGMQGLAPANLGYAPNPPLRRGTPFTLDDELRHLTRALDDAAPADTGVHLVAHSYGGLLALYLAKQLGPRVRSLFLYEPVLFGALLRELESGRSVDPSAAAEVRLFAEHPWFLTDEARMGTPEWLETFIDYWNRPGSWARMPEAARAQTEAWGWKMSQEVRAIFTDPRRFHEHAHPAPTTLLLGGRTTAASRATTLTLAATAFPHAARVELPKAGHMGALTHPDEVLGNLREHFARLAPA